VPFDQAFQQCIDAFVRRDYESCARQAVQLAFTPPEEDLPVPALHQLFQVLLISLQRTGRPDKAEEVGSWILGAMADEPWYPLLLQITLVKIDPMKVFQQAATDEQRCQMLFYAGALMASLEKKETARETLLNCLRMPADCLERRLAQAELADLGVRLPAGAEAGDEQELDQLREQVHRFYHQGRFDQALPLAVRALPLARTLLGPRHPTLVGCLNDLALVHLQLGQFTAAEPLLREALETRRQVPGEKHPDYALSLANLGELYREMGRWADAEPLLQQALALNRQLRGENHEAVAMDLNNLGLLYHQTGRFAAAEPLYRQALDLFRSLHGTAHPLAVRALNNLAAVLQSQGQLAEAEPLFQQALEWTRQSAGEQHPDYALALTNLAGIFWAQGKFAAALPLMEQGLALYRATLGANHPACGRTLNALVAIHHAQGNYAVAESLGRQAVTLWRTLVGENHSGYADALSNLAAVLQAQGNYSAAEPLYQQALAIDQQVFGKGHLNCAPALNNLATLYMAMGRLAEAEPLLGQVLEIQRRDLPENHPQLAGTLNNLGGLYLKQGRLVEAEPHLAQALKVGRATLGEEHPSLANSLEHLAGLYTDLGKAEVALALFQQALAIRQKTLGPHHPDLALARNNLALQLEKQGRWAEAEALCRQVLDEYHPSGGEYHPQRAQALTILGMVYQARGDYGAAEPLFRQVADLGHAAGGPDHPSYLDGLEHLAVLYRHQGRFSEAAALAGQALELHRRAHGEDHPRTAGLLTCLAEVHRVQGNYPAAERQLQQALDLRRAARGEQHADVAEALNNLAVLYQELGRYAAAEPLFRQVLAIGRVVWGDKHPSYAEALNNLAALYTAIGRYAGGEPLLRQALPLQQQALDIKRRALGDKHPATAISQLNLASLCNGLGRFAEAEQLLSQARDTWQALGGPSHPALATCLNNLALLKHAQGDYPAAETLFRQALAIQQAVLQETHLDYAGTLVNLAGVCLATSRLAEGFDLLERAAVFQDRTTGQVFAISSESQRLALLDSLRGNLAIFLYAVLRHGRDFPRFQGVVYDLILRRKALAAEALAVQRDALLGGRYPELEPKLRELILLRRQTARRTLAGPGSERPDVHQKLLEDWNAQKERLETELARIPEMNLEQRLRAVDRQAVAEALPKGSALVEWVRFQEFDFQARRAHQEALWKPARYLALVLLAGKPDNVQLIDLGEAEPIDQLIADFRSGLTGEAERRPGRKMVPHRPESVSWLTRLWRGLSGGRKMVKRGPERVSASREGAGQRLRTAVFDKLIPALGGHQRLLLAPDGDLTRLPFEVLPAADGRPLIDTYQISYVGCGRDVLRFGAKSTGQPADPLVIADPDFDLDTQTAARQSASASPVAFPPPAPTTVADLAGRRSRDFDRDKYHFGRLPGTHTEGERIAALLGVQPWLEQDALEGRLKVQCRSPRILHLATHGFFLQDQPRDRNREHRDLGVIGGEPGGLGRLSGPLPENPLLRAGLALAGVNTWLRHGLLPPEAEDGLLTAEDVSGLDLLDTELVVLSACETGLGEVRTGEGVFGLQRAFILAGAKTLVMSLWSVPDEATRELMEEFYRRLLAGEARADALHAAQQALRRKYPEPYFWGAFVCLGNPGPLLPVAGHVSPIPPC